MQQHFTFPRGTGWAVLILGVVCAIWLLHSVLLPFVVGALVAYLFDPVADRLEARGFSRGSATSIITVCFFVFFVGAMVAITPLLLDQLVGLAASVPSVVEHVSQDLTTSFESAVSAYGQEAMDAFRQSAAKFSEALVRMLGRLAEGALHSGFAALNLISLLLITPVVTFYLLRDWDLILAELDELLPPRDAPLIRRILQDINTTLAGFLRGQVQVCLLLSLFYATGLWLTGLKFGVVVGLLTGLLAILPYVGFAAGCVTALGLALVQFESWGPIAGVAAVFALGQALESYFLTPKLVGAQVGLHPVWIIFALLAGATLFGFVGVLIAVPVAAIIGVLVRYGVAYWRNRNHPPSSPQA